MINPLLILGGLGAGLLLLMSKKPGSGSSPSTLNPAKATPVTGASGHKWLLELVGKTEPTVVTAETAIQASYIVYEPAAPPVHAAYPVIQFAQIGDSPARQLVARFPSVPPEIYRQALKDFLVQETF
jgi:hypothetical protein